MSFKDDLINHLREVKVLGNVNMFDKLGVVSQLIYLGHEESALYVNDCSGSSYVKLLRQI